MFGRHRPHSDSVVIGHSNIRRHGRVSSNRIDVPSVPEAVVHRIEIHHTNPNHCVGVAHDVCCHLAAAAAALCLRLLRRQRHGARILRLRLPLLVEPQPSRSDCAWRWMSTRI